VSTDGELLTLTATQPLSNADTFTIRSSRGIVPTGYEDRRADSKVVARTGPMPYR
jgi:hypothetical protein